MTLLPASDIATLQDGVVTFSGVDLSRYDLELFFEDSGSDPLPSASTVGLVREDEMAMFLARLGVTTNYDPAAPLSALVWQFIGDSGNNNVSQGLFSATNILVNGVGNTFGAYAFNCKLGQGAVGNTFGILTNGYVTGLNFTRNRVGDYANGANVGRNFDRNEIGHHVSNLSAGVGCTRNVIANNVNGLTLGDNVKSCFVGPGCTGIAIGAGCERVELYQCKNNPDGSTFVVPDGTTDAVYRNNVLQGNSAGTPGNGTVKTVNGNSPDAAGNVLLPQSDIYAVSPAKRAQVIGLFSGMQFSVAEVDAPSGEQNPPLGARFADFGLGNFYELVPNFDAPDPQQNATPTWVGY